MKTFTNKIDLRKRKSKTQFNRPTNYKNLEVWKLAYSLVLDVYPLIEYFPRYEDNNISDQLRRAITGLPLNIAEGASSKFKKIFFSQLNYAYCSSKEVEVLLMLCRDLKYINNNDFFRIYNKLDRFKSRTYKLMEKLDEEMN
jgi:four helix bundle protein